MAHGEVTYPKLVDAVEIIRHFHVSEDVIGEYNKEDQIDIYTDSLVCVKYTGAQRCAETLAGILDNKEDSLVLDLACGTGEVGKHLSAKGFRTIHALDAAANILERCKKIGCYSHFMCSKLGGGNRVGVEDNAYSACVMAGGLLPGHVPGDCQDEIVRLVKPGGFFVNVYRTAMVSQPCGQDWAAHTSRLEASGQWSLYGRLYFPKYIYGQDGVVDIYRIGTAT